MSRYRVVYSSTFPPSDAGPNGLEFVEAAGVAEALAVVAARHETISIISCTLEANSVEEQRDGLIRALRPLYTVCRALLDNHHASPIFTSQTRLALEGMCADAAAALKAAGYRQPGPPLEPR